MMRAICYVLLTPTALAHATPDSDDIWMVFPDGIKGWWSEEANVPVAEVYRRLRPLRADIVKRLTDEGPAYRHNRWSTSLYVRRDASRRS
jgi:hypothetical protein